MDGGCLNVLMLPNGNPGRDGGDCDVNIALSFILESVAQICARVAVAASQNLLFFAFSRATEMALLPSPNAHALLKLDSAKALMHILESLSMFKGCFDEWSHPKWIFGDRSNHSQMLVKQYRAGNYARKYRIGNRGVTGKQLDSMFAKNRLRDLVQIDTLCSCDQDERHHVSASLDKDSNAHMAQLGDNKGPDTGSRLIGSGHVQWLVASKSDDDDDDDDDGDDDDDDDDDDDEYEGEEDEDEEEEEGGGKKGKDGKENNPVGEDGDNYDEDSGPEDEDEDEDDDDDNGGDGDDDDDGDEGEADEEEEDDEDDEDEDEDEAAHEPPRKRRK